MSSGAFFPTGMLSKFMMLPLSAMLINGVIGRSNINDGANYNRSWSSNQQLLYYNSYNCLFFLFQWHVYTAMPIRACIK